MARVDFEVSGSGTVYLLRPLTRAACAWIAGHLPADALRLGNAGRRRVALHRGRGGRRDRGRAAGALMAGYTDYLGRRIRVGAVVVYAVLTGRIGGGQPLRRGVILGFEDSYAWIRMLPDRAQGRPATVRIHHARVLVMPTALTARQAAQLRAHVVRPRTPSERAQRRERSTVSQNVLTAAPTTPEQILEWTAGIGDPRQAEYQRKMSALLAGRM
jgi:hypothetical protein